MHYILGVPMCACECKDYIPAIYIYMCVCVYIYIQNLEHAHTIEHVHESK